MMSVAISVLHTIPTYLHTYHTPTTVGGFYWALPDTGHRVDKDSAPCCHVGDSLSVCGDGWFNLSTLIATTEWNQSDSASGGAALISHHPHAQSTMSLCSRTWSVTKRPVQPGSGWATLWLEQWIEQRNKNKNKYFEWRTITTIAI